MIDPKEVRMAIGTLQFDIFFCQSDPNQWGSRKSFRFIVEVRLTLLIELPGCPVRKVQRPFASRIPLQSQQWRKC